MADDKQDEHNDPAPQDPDVESTAIEDLAPTNAPADDVRGGRINQIKAE